MKALTKKQLRNLIRGDVTKFLRKTYTLPDYLANASAKLELEKLLSTIDPQWQNKIVLSSARQDWMTPEYVLRIIRQVAPIALDPAASPRGIVNAWTEYYGPPCGVDGLQAGWQIPIGAQVYVNPPYGRGLRLWIQKMAAEFEKYRCTITCLIPARTGTSYWKDFIYPTASAICYWNGGEMHPSRITFVDADTLKPAKAGATFDAAFVHWSTDPARFCEVFSAYGRTEIV